MKLRILPSYDIHTVRDLMSGFFSQAHEQFQYPALRGCNVDKSQLNRVNQNVMSVVYHAESGVYEIIYGNTRTSEYTSLFTKFLLDLCTQQPCYRLDLLNSQEKKHILSVYQRGELASCHLDCDLIVKILGIEEAVSDKDSSDERRCYSTRAVCPIYRLLLFLNNQVTEREVSLILQSQYNDLHEVIIYRSNQFKPVLSVLEACDGISAYPENMTWKPIGLLGRCNPINDGSDVNYSFGQPSDMNASEVLEAFLTYSIQAKVDNIGLSSAMDLQTANISKIYLNSSAISALPAVQYILPAQWKQEHLTHPFFSISPQRYHSLPTNAWAALLCNPKLAWDVGQKLCFFKSHMASMTYPAGKEIIGVIWNFLSTLVSDIKLLDAVPEALQGYLNLRSWVFIRDNSHSLLASDSNLKACYNQVWDEMMSIVNHPTLPYEAGKVYRFVVHFLSFMQAFYSSNTEYTSLSLGDRTILEYYNFDCFPLFLLKNFTLDFMLSSSATPALPMVIHINNYEECHNIRFSGISSACHYASHKFSLFADMKMYQQTSVSRLLCSDARHKLICSLTYMLASLSHGRGVMDNIVGEQKLFLGLEGSTFDVNKEVDLLKMVLTVLFCELQHEHTKANFFGAFDLGVPSLNKMQGFIASKLFKYTISPDSESPKVLLTQEYIDWNAQSTLSYDWLPVNETSPLKFFALTAWLHFCFMQYSQGARFTLGDQASLEQFANEYLFPLIQTRQRFICALAAKERWAVDKLPHFPEVTQGSPPNSRLVHRLFSMREQDLNYFSNTFCLKDSALFAHSKKIQTRITSRR